MSRLTYAIDTSKGETPESVARKRALAEQLAGSIGSPTDIGSGLTALGKGIGSRIAANRADKAEAAGMAVADDLMAPIKEKLAQVFGGSSSPSTVSPTSTAPMAGGNDVFSGFMDTVKAGGVDNPYALAAIASTGQRESGFTPTNSTRTWSDPSESGQPGTAGGIMSWRGPRYEALAATRDLSPQGQAKFFLQEDPQLIARLNTARSAEEAQKMMNEAWKFAGYNREGGEAAARIAQANAFLPTFQQGASGQAPQSAAEAVNMMGSGGQGDLGGSAGNDQLGAGGDWLKYDYGDKTIRNKPISPRLQNALGFLPELGVTMVVFSGGQDAIGQSDQRTGSTRHDHGDAADVFFYKDGRQLNPENPQDLPIFQEIYNRGTANGLTGFGQGDGYMRPGSMHIGFGKEGIWGAGGEGKNAAPWLQALYNGGGGGQQMAGGSGMDTMSGSAGNDTMAAMKRTGSGMDVWQGRAGQGRASDGSQLQRMPDGSVQRTSAKYGYTETIRDERPPSERGPSMRQPGQGGGLRSMISKLFGVDDGQQQPMQQPAPMQQGFPQQPMSLNGAPVGQVERQPLPQTLQTSVQPMGSQQSARGMSAAFGPQYDRSQAYEPPVNFGGVSPQDMAGAAPGTTSMMLSPQTAMPPQSMQPREMQAPLGGAQQMPVPQQPQQPPAMQPQGQQDPWAGQRQPTQPQQAPQIPQQVAQVAQVRQQQTGAQIPLAQLLQAAQNPWVAKNPLYSGIITKLISNQLEQGKPMTPQEIVEYEGALLGIEKSRLELEQMRNPPVPEAVRILDERAQRANLKRGTSEYQKFMVEGGGKDGITIKNNFGVNPDKFMEEGNKTANERLNTIITAGQAAPEFIGQIQQLADLSKMIGTGKGAEFTAAIGPYAQALGVEVDGLGEMQAYNAMVSRLVPLMRPPGSGVQSDMDTRMFLDSLLSLGKTPQGNEIIAQTFEAVAQTRMRAAEIASMAYQPKEAGGITWQEAEKQIRALPNPYQLFKESRKAVGKGQNGAKDDTPAPEGMDPETWKFISPEDRKLWQN